MNAIQKIIEDNNIILDYSDIKKHYKLNALYLNINKQPVIVVDKNLHGIKEDMAVAEEVAHYCVGAIPTLPFATDYHNRLIRSKNEFKAFKWMQDKLIPPNIENQKYDTLWEVSEELNMPIDFVKQAMEYRKENQNGSIC